MQNVYHSQCIAYIIDCIIGIIMNILQYILSNSLRKLLSDLEQCWKREVYYALFALIYQNYWLSYKQNIIAQYI